MNKEFLYRILSSLVLIPLSFFFIIKGSIIFNCFIFVIFLVTLYEWHKMSKKNSFNVFGHIFLIFSFISVYNLRNSFGENSVNIFFLILIICISTDIGGYAFGKILKGPKLIKISPKKTYAGMIGGYLFSILMVYLYCKYSNLFSIYNLKFTNQILFITFLTSTVSQIGDVIISYFKRLSKIKDTGNIIPGHGGLLDRIDGMIFAFPFSYIIFSINLIK